MTDLVNQPFLLSMMQAAQQTGNFDDYQTLLKEQQTVFKRYLYDFCQPDVPLPKRFEFLSLAEYEVCSIRLNYAEKLRKTDMIFYGFWAMLIVDTRRYIANSMNVLHFQKTCPSHLLTEPGKPVPEYRWTGSRNDLLEGLAAIFHSKIITLKNGKPITFAAFAQFVGSFFGIIFTNPYDELRILLNRKKDPTPFLNRLIVGLKKKSSYDNDVKDRL